MLLPRLLFSVLASLTLLTSSAAGSGTLSVYLSPPSAQSSTVQGAATETFNQLTTEVKTAAYTSPAGIGTYTGSQSAPFAILAAGVYGGGTDSANTSPTNFFSVGNSTNTTNPVVLTLSQPAAYFGFWWSAGDQYNRVALYQGDTLYATFSTQDVLTFLNNGSGTITASNGSQYQTSAYFGNPNIASGSRDASEPFVYVNFVITGATIDKLAFYNTNTQTAFESDNHSVIFSGNTVTVPATFVPVETLTLTPTVAAPAFTPAAGSYTSSQTVAITCATTGASIRYTTDGSTPNATTGTLYSGAVTVSGTTTVNAIAYKTDMADSAVASATYTFPVAVAVTPAIASLYGGGTQQFAATVTNTSNTAVTWAISPAGTGSITTAGLYTAPATVATQQTVTITATGAADATKTATATVTLMPPVSVTVTPATASIYGGGTQQFTATVANATNTAVTWAISPAGTGSITTAGLYTAPATVAVQQTVTITATSAADAAKTATTTITLLPPVAVTVTPGTVTLVAGGTQQFTAAVTNTANTAVTWSVSPSGAGTISAAGLYTAPATIAEAQTATVTATSQGDTTRTATATVTLAPVSVTMAPAAVSVYGTGTQQFTATVANASNTAVTWTISPAGTGSITTAGLYTAPAAVATQQTVTVTATSQADTTKTATATVTLVPVSVTVTPATVSLYGEGTQQFAATVANASNTAVTWAISPAGTGSITAAGLYTAPATVSTQQTVTITATSQADATKSATVTVTLLPAVSVTVAPAAASLYGGGTQQFTSTVVNASNTAVTWTISPADTGSITTTGLYTAPATVATQQTVTITATSQADATKAATSTVTLLPSVSVTVTPATATVYGGGTQQCTASVANTSNTAVTWSINPAGAGSISSTGLFEAPISMTRSSTA